MGTDGTPYWDEVDLAPILAGDLIPLAPDFFTREDGQALLYRGFIHSFVGPSESLKSWAAQWACAQELLANRHVFYFDYEDIPESVLLRLLALGVPPELILRYFHYYNPEVGARPHLIETMLSRVALWCPWLCIVDGVTEAMTIEGFEIGDNAGIAKWLDVLPRRLKMLGSAVVTIDHTPHSDASRPIGGQHKKAGIDVIYVFRVQSKLSQAFDAPITGVSQIKIGKDRPGGLRAHALNEIIGSFHATANLDGTVHARILGPTSTDDALMKAVSLATQDMDQLPTAVIRSLVKGRNEAIDGALASLVSLGHMTRGSGPRGSVLHTWVSLYTGVTVTEMNDGWKFS